MPTSSSLNKESIRIFFSLCHLHGSSLSNLDFSECRVGWAHQIRSINARPTLDTPKFAAKHGPLWWGRTCSHFKKWGSDGRCPSSAQLPKMGVAPRFHFGHQRATSANPSRKGLISGMTKRTDLNHLLSDLILCDIPGSSPISWA